MIEVKHSIGLPGVWEATKEAFTKYGSIKLNCETLAEADLFLGNTPTPKRKNKQERLYQGHLRLFRRIEEVYPALADEIVDGISEVSTIPSQIPDGVVTVRTGEPQACSTKVA